MNLRIACVGGGPGGLFFAALAKQAHPEAEITVFERNRAEDTFGFGVVFSDATLAGIHAADPVLRTALDELGTHWDDIEVRLKGETFSCGGNGMTAIVRKTLLQLLQERAIAAGVDLRFSTEVDLEDLADYDLVVACDGANSRIRERLADQLEPSYETATAKFIWFGTTYSFDGLTFVHVRGEHGVFAVHGYPIAPEAEHVHRRDRRGDVAPGRPGRLRRHPAAGAERPGVEGRTSRSSSPSRSTVIRWWSTTPAGPTSAPGGRAAGPTATSSCSATPRTPRTSRSARAPRWRWRTRSRSPRLWATTRTTSPARSRRYEAAARPPGGEDPGLGPAQPVLVGALRPLPRHTGAVAVRLPLPQPQHRRREARPARPRLRRRRAAGLDRCPRRRGARQPADHRHLHLPRPTGRPRPRSRSPGCACSR